MPSEPVKIATSKMPFKQMENIASFLNRVERLGVPAHDRFLTVDLYEAKNLDQVVNCIFALSRHAAAKGFDGPVLGPKLANKNERNFSEEQLAQSRMIVPKLMSFTSKVGATPVTGGRREIGGTYVERPEDGVAELSLGDSGAPERRGSGTGTSTPVSRSPLPPTAAPTATVAPTSTWSVGTPTATLSAPAAAPAPVPEPVYRQRDRELEYEPRAVAAPAPSPSYSFGGSSGAAVTPAPAPARKAVVEEPSLRPSAVVESRGNVAVATAYSAPAPAQASYYSSSSTQRHAPAARGPSPPPPPPPEPAPQPAARSFGGLPPPPRRQAYQYDDDEDDEEVVVIDEEEDEDERDAIIGAYGGR
ncbi:Muscle-specific protein 20 [Cladochytrium tenue]|nr:Muscle-specific protein 20 [Cladochytrium tenue]